MVNLLASINYSRMLGSCRKLSIDEDDQKRKNSQLLTIQLPQKLTEIQ